jgi:uncharacterized protein (TIGR02271 family)
MAGNIPQSTGSYDNTLVAVFDNYNDAQRAVESLSSAGFTTPHVQLNPQDDSSSYAAGDSSGSAPGDPGPNRNLFNEKIDRDEKSHKGGISGFFSSLFGGSDDRENHDVYSESVRRGHYVLTVDAKSDNELDRAAEIINQFNPVDIDGRSSTWKQQGWTGYDASAPRFTQDEITQDRTSYASLKSPSNLQNEVRIPVAEEELKVGKREVQRGGVRVIKRIRETPVNESVQLRDEHIKVEHRPVSDTSAALAGTDAFKEQSFELRETAEEAVVSKSARVVEEVVVGKEVSQRTETIDDTLRHNEVDIEHLGASGGASAGTMNDDDAYFRSHWQSTYGASGGRYEDYAPAYTYGSSIASSSQYQNRQWSEVEPQLRNDWESTHPKGTWEKVKDAVRHGTERVSSSRQH